MPHSVNHANPIAKLAPSDLFLAPRQVHKDVTLWGLRWGGPDRARCGDGLKSGELWVLEEALEDGFVGVGAASEGGRATVESRAPAPVWVPAGEPLGSAGVAAETCVLPPHATRVVRCWPARFDDGEACSRCCRGLAQGFLPLAGQVGFIAAVHDRVVALELVLPLGSYPRRLAQRLGAWAPFLLRQGDSGQAESVGPIWVAPEALLEAVIANPFCGDRFLGGAQVRVALAGLDPTG